VVDKEKNQLALHKAPTVQLDQGLVISLVSPQIDFLKLAHTHGMTEFFHKDKVEVAIILVGRLIS
jgi:hypothetical protein